MAKYFRKRYNKKNFGRNRRFKIRKYFGKQRRYTMKSTKSDTNPIAPRFITRLKYAQQVTTTLSGGVFGTPQRFNLNSIYDPDRTGVGHQPFGHDLLQTLYNRYRVYKVTGYVRFLTSASGVAVTACVTPENNTTTYNNIEHMMESPNSHVTYLNHQTNSPLVKFRVDLPRLGGYSRREYSTSSRTEAQFGADPSEIQTLAIGLYAGSTATINAQVVMIYHVECTDPKEVSQS